MLDFTEIYDEKLSQVYGFIAYRVTNRADAEDLTQQTFERALAHWEQFDSRRSSITTWLLAIARNLLIDHYRAGARRGTTVELAAIPAAEQPRSAGLDQSLGVSPELSAALGKLTERERELIALRYGGDLSGPEVAAVTGLTLANVQQLLSRSLRKLRGELDEKKHPQCQSRPASRV